MFLQRAILSSVLITGLLGGTQLMHGASKHIIFRFPLAPLAWRVVNDTVMGGRSRSRGVEGEESLLFEGQLSLENNGGFTSIRSSTIGTLSAESSDIQLRVRGDGRAYQLLLQTMRTRRGVSYQHSFETRAGEWVVVELPLSAFRAKWRGRFVAGAPQLGAEDIRSVGFLLADKIAGPFRLEIAEISALTFGAGAAHGAP